MPTDTLARLQLPKRAFAVVLAGGRGTRLKQLTDHRAKPAVYFGGNGQLPLAMTGTGLFVLLGGLGFELARRRSA